MLSSPGLGSGLDVNNIVSQLMAVESRPLATLDGKEAKQQAKLSAFGNVKGALSSFQDGISALTDPATFSAVTASFSDDTIATASARPGAVTSNYSVEIQSLAQTQKLKSENFASASATVGSGTLTIQFGAYSSEGAFTLNQEKAAQSITIAPNQSSLAGVRDAINDADAGISASIVNDGSGDRLVISSKDTGLSNALRITVTDDDSSNNDNTGLSQLAFDASTGGTTNLTETVAAENANLIIDGIAISKASRASAMACGSDRSDTPPMSKLARVCRPPYFNHRDPLRSGASMKSSIIASWLPLMQMISGWAISQRRTPAESSPRST